MDGNATPTSTNDSAAFVVRATMASKLSGCCIQRCSKGRGKERKLISLLPTTRCDGGCSLG